MTRRGLTAAALVLAAAAAGGCGDDDSADTGTTRVEERSDPPAKPPRGWRTVRNRRAGFTLSAPRSWTARTKGPSTLIRSDDRLVSITVAADRTTADRQTEPARFARQTIRALPGFKGSIRKRSRRVPRSPYRTARVEARGRLRTSKIRQRITAAVYQRPDVVTYEILVFRNAEVRPRFNDPIVDRLLRSFRAQAPDYTP